MIFQLVYQKDNLNNILRNTEHQYFDSINDIINFIKTNKLNPSCCEISCKKDDFDTEWK